MPSPLVPALDALSIIHRLTPWARAGGALVFDADGTLWTCDVGIDCYVAALERRALRPQAREALLAEALRHDLADADDVARLDANALGDLLQRAFEAGHYAERPATEMQVWAYAGWTDAELRAHARETLSLHQLSRQIYQPLMPVLIWARDAGLRTLIVSASPQSIVEEATRSLGFTADDIVAGRPAMQGDVILPALREPLPYGPLKAEAGRALLGDSPWLATFGDSAFDAEMLQQAKLPVAVRPKPELLERLASIPDAVRFIE